MGRPFPPLPLATLAFFFSAAPAPAAKITYTSATGHYSVTIPGGWKKIPQARMDELDEIEEVIKDMYRLSGFSGLKIAFPAGYYPDYGPDFTALRPFVLVQEVDMGPRYRREMGTDFVDEGKEAWYLQALAARGDLTTPGSYRLDKKRHRMSVTIAFRPPGFDLIKCLVVVYLGKRRVVQLNCFALATEYQDHLPAFSRLADSLKYEPGYGYGDPSPIPRNQAEAAREREKKDRSPRGWFGTASSSAKTWFSVGIGVAVTLVVLLVGVITMRSASYRPPDPDRGPRGRS